jgi:hypothetical protein
LRNHGSSGNLDRSNFDCTGVVLMSRKEPVKVIIEIYSCKRGAFAIHCQALEGLRNVKEINEQITI